MTSGAASERRRIDNLTLEYPTSISRRDHPVAGPAPAHHLLRQPVALISGRIDRAYLEKAVGEISDAAPHEIAGHAAWLRTRLKLYAPVPA